MNEIAKTHPEVVELFPCHLTKNNAIDKKLMDVVIHCAVKGIGPAAMVENLVSWHELEWQKRENLWAAYVLRRLAKPAFFQRQNIP